MQLPRGNWVDTQNPVAGVLPVSKLSRTSQDKDKKDARAGWEMKE